MEDDCPIVTYSVSKSSESSTDQEIFAKFVFIEEEASSLKIEPLEYLNDFGPNMTVYLTATSAG